MAREYSKFLSSFWTGETGRKLRGDPEAQVVAAYLLTNHHANMLGVYYMPALYISHETGLTIEGALKGLRRVSEGGFCAYDEASEYVFVYEMAKIQIGDKLKPADNRVKAVNKEYENLDNNPFLLDFYEKYVDCFHLQEQRGFKGASKGLRRGFEASSSTSTSTSNSKITTMSGNESENQQLSMDESQSPPQETSAPRKQHKQTAINILEFLNSKCGRNYKPSSANLDLIIARLKEGHEPQELTKVVIDKFNQWHGDDKMSQYLRPATLFNKTKFSQYVGELPPELRA